MSDNGNDPQEVRNVFAEHAADSKHDEATVAPKMKAFFTEKAIEILLVSKVLGQFQLPDISERVEKIADDLNEISEFFSDPMDG